MVGVTGNFPEFSLLCATKITASGAPRASGAVETGFPPMNFCPDPFFRKATKSRYPNSFDGASMAADSQNNERVKTKAGAEMKTVFIVWDFVTQGENR